MTRLYIKQDGNKSSGSEWVDRLTSDQKFVDRDQGINVEYSPEVPRAAEKAQGDSSL